MRLTIQQCFDKGLQGIRHQGYQPSVSAETRTICRYLGTGGKKCWAGHTAESPMFEGLEGLSVDSMRRFDELSAEIREGLDAAAVQRILEIWPEGSEDLDLLACMQLDLHDTVLRLQGAAAFEEACKAFAEEHGLIYNPPGV